MTILVLEEFGNLDGVSVQNLTLVLDYQLDPKYQVLGLPVCIPSRRSTSIVSKIMI